MAGFYVENFGCRAARADGEAVSIRLLGEGLREEQLTDADLVVVNTCSVTAEADRDARAFVRKTARLNPGAKVLVTGCYAQRAPHELASLDGVAAVVGNSHKGLIPEIALGLLKGHGSVPREADRGLNRGPAWDPAFVPAAELLPQASVAGAGPQIWVDDRFAHSQIENAQVLPGLQTRPNLKIQEGCGNRCTFCIIPSTRGSSRSLAFEKIMAQVEGFVDGGGKELVLSGINLGRWGRDLDSAQSLASLLRIVLTRTSLPRLRLSSIEPMDWTPELVGLMREFGGSRLARHAHLPLQSGSDAVLRRMHRRYRPWHYAEKVEQLIDAAGPELAVGADVMVGFPGETDGEFGETYELVRSLPFTYLHLFPFSPRPGAPGWELHARSPVPARAVQERMTALRSLIAEKTDHFHASFLGRWLPAITLNPSPTQSALGHSAALTDNYLPVELDQAIAPNQLVQVKITSLSQGKTLLGGAVQGEASSTRLNQTAFQ